MHFRLQGSTAIKCNDQLGIQVVMEKVPGCSLKFVYLVPHYINYTIKKLNAPIKIIQIKLMAIIYRQIRGVLKTITIKLRIPITF